MAKNKKELFKANLSRQPNKPKDSRIEKVANDLQVENPIPRTSVKKKVEIVKEKGFHLKLSITDFNKLTEVSKKTHIPKKYIVLEALKNYYEKNGHS